MKRFANNILVLGTLMAALSLWQGCSEDKPSSAPRVAPPAEKTDDENLEDKNSNSSAGADALTQAGVPSDFANANSTQQIPAPGESIGTYGDLGNTNGLPGIGPLSQTTLEGAGNANNSNSPVVTGEQTFGTNENANSYPGILTSSTNGNGNNNNQNSNNSNSNQTASKVNEYEEYEDNSSGQNRGISAKFFMSQSEGWLEFAFRYPNPHYPNGPRFLWNPESSEAVFAAGENGSESGETLLGDKYGVKEIQAYRYKDETLGLFFVDDNGELLHIKQQKVDTHLWGTGKIVNLIEEAPNPQFESKMVSFGKAHFIFVTRTNITDRIELNYMKPNGRFYRRILEDEATFKWSEELRTKPYHYSSEAGEFYAEYRRIVASVIARERQAGIQILVDGIVQEYKPEQDGYGKQVYQGLKDVGTFFKGIHKSSSWEWFTEGVNDIGDYGGKKEQEQKNGWTDPYSQQRYK